MKTVLYSMFLILCLHVSANSQTAKKEILTNQTIIDLHKAGLSKDIINTKISAATCNFDLSTQGLINLKKSGIPDDVLSRMFEKSGNAATDSQDGAEKTTASLDALESGLYLNHQEIKKYIEIEPSVLTNTKSGGLGEAMKRAMVSGLINAKTRASLAGGQAETVISSKTPEFIFVFDTKEKQGLGTSSSFLSSAQNPKEFFLLKLTVVKNTREVVVGKSNSVSSDIGIDDRLKVAFSSKKLQNGIYEVTPNVSLTAGEYCFMIASSTSIAGTSSKVFDFSVR